MSRCIILRVNEELGHLLRRRRELGGLTQDQVAAALRDQGVESTSRSTIASQERGEVDLPRPAMVNALAKILPVTVEEICEAMGFQVQRASEPKGSGELVVLLRTLDPRLRKGF